MYTFLYNLVSFREYLQSKEDAVVDVVYGVLISHLLNISIAATEEVHLLYVLISVINQLPLLKKNARVISKFHFEIEKRRNLILE